jgi:hypothetical protein
MRPMHLRPPSIDRGVTSGLWAVGLALFIFLGSVSVGLSAAPAFIVSVVAGGAIFLYIRLYGEDPL